MNKILLSSELLKVDAIHKPTKARFFQYLEVGDTFTITTYLKGIGRTRSGLYASDFHFKCIKSNGEEIIGKMTANQAMNCLSNFEISSVCK